MLRLSETPVTELLIFWKSSSLINIKKLFTKLVAFLKNLLH
jgi:hypothetical protein